MLPHIYMVVLLYLIGANMHRGGVWEVLLLPAVGVLQRAACQWFCVADCWISPTIDGV